ncbi:MAG: peptidoglycan-binding protein [Candidatus Paceibacterota bacterium]
MKKYLLGLMVFGFLFIGQNVFTAGAASTTVVYPEDMTSNLGDVLSNPNKWFFWNDENNTIDNSLGGFVAGPMDPTNGDDSVQISVSGSQRRNLATYQFSGTPLASIKQLSFETYNPSTGNGGSANRSAYLNFNVDFDGSDTWQRRLVYVPANNGAVIQDQWQKWDAINEGNAMWNYSGANWPVTGELGTTLKTWSQILTDYSGARIRVNDSWLGLRVGEPYNDGYTENVDSFVFGTETETKTFDFERSFGNVQITRYSCPEGTTVIRSANGVGQTVPAGCVLASGKTYGYVYGTQTDANAPYPELSAPVMSAGSTDINGVLTIPNLLVNGRYLIVETNPANPTEKLPHGDVLGLYCIGDGDTSDSNDNQELTFVTESGTTNCVGYDDNGPAPVVNGTLVVKKIVVNNENGVKTAGDFSFKINGGGSVNFMQNISNPLLGENTISLAPGTYTITEDSVANYAALAENCTAIVITSEQTATCTFTNDDFIHSGGGSAAPTVSGSVLGASTENTDSMTTEAPKGEVLGATTCSAIYLNDFLAFDKKNNPEQVKLLQTFLNENLSLNPALAVDGKFGKETRKAVIAFQEKYASEILAPWVALGIPEGKGTGNVYKTTKWKINMLKCPDLKLEVPQLP